MEGRACQPIADNLNLEGVPTRNGGIWNGSRVWSILTSQTYNGEGQHCRVRYTKRDNGLRDVKRTKHMPVDTWVSVPYPRIVDDHTWRKARELRKHPQRKVWDRQRKHDVVYLLESILWCDHCGKRYRPGASYRVYRHVTKDGVVHQRKSDTLRLRYMCDGGTKSGCPRPTIYAHVIETVVWDSVADFVSRPHVFKTSDQFISESIAGKGSSRRWQASRNSFVFQVVKPEIVILFFNPSKYSCYVNPLPSESGANG